MDNLLENAVEHNDADEPRIDVGIDAGGETVRLTVADNGPGIPDNQKESILYPESGETDGSGLSLVRTLVEGYDGSVRAEENEPRGSRFVVELPRATAGATDQPPSSTLRTRTEVLPNSPRRTNGIRHTLTRF